MDPLRQPGIKSGDAAHPCHPVSPQSKGRPEWEALQHGFATASSAVLSNESPERFRQLLEGYILEHRPVGITEQQLVYDLAKTAWRLARLGLIENAVLDLRMDLQQHQVERMFAGSDEAARAGLAWSAEADQSRALGLLNTFVGRLERSWHRSLQTLHRLQSHRRAIEQSREKGAPPPEKLPNEPNFDSSAPPAGNASPNSGPPPQNSPNESNAGPLEPGSRASGFAVPPARPLLRPRAPCLSARPRFGCSFRRSAAILKRHGRSPFHLPARLHELLPRARLRLPHRR